MDVQSPEAQNPYGKYLWKSVYQQAFCFRRPDKGNIDDMFYDCEQPDVKWFIALQYLKTFCHELLSY